MKEINCDDCVYSDIANWWKKDANSPVIPELWCKKHRHFCEDITDCEYYTEDSEYDSN